MLSKINKFKPFLLTFVFGLFLAISSLLMPVSAKCADNIVPNPLDPNCELPAGQTISIGFLVNRFVIFLPYIVTLIAVGCYVWGSVRLILAQDEEGKKEAIRIYIYVTAGLAAFFSMWLILFIVSIVTGVDLLKAIGQ